MIWGAVGLLLGHADNVWRPLLQRGQWSTRSRERVFVQYVDVLLSLTGIGDWRTGWADWWRARLLSSLGIVVDVLDVVGVVDVVDNDGDNFWRTEYGHCFLSGSPTKIFHRAIVNRLKHPEFYSAPQKIEKLSKLQYCENAKSLAQSSEVLDTEISREVPSWGALDLQEYRLSKNLKIFGKARFISNSSDEVKIWDNFTHLVRCKPFLELKVYSLGVKWVNKELKLRI